MDLLTFARGPALKFALAVFFIGVAWRIVGFALLRWNHASRESNRSRMQGILGGLVAAGSRSWPHPEFVGRTGAGEAIGYAYHIGLFVVMLFFAPHIQFFGSFFGIRWPAVPTGIINIVAVLTLVLLLAVLLRRLTHRVLRLISNFDDYFSWFIVTLVVVTGLMTAAHYGGPYQTLLGLHILSFDLLLVWFPFGKLMHMFYIFPSRVFNGYSLTRKGAAT